MANGIRTGDPSGFNEWRTLKFRVGFQVRQTPEEGRGNNNKDEDNGQNNLNDKNHQASS